jgi:hypothetical protein
LVAVRATPQDGGMEAGGFIERDEADADGYLAEKIGGGVSREELIESMEQLLVFTKKAAYQWHGDWEALIYATVARSGRTFDGICKLLRAGLAVQAAMLSRSLFEDMVIGHWLLFNHEEPDWLVEKFLRQREAIALHQRKLQRETGMTMGPPLSVPDGAEARAKDLFEEFGKEAQRNWWDPGREGHGEGQDVKLRKLVHWLEEAAAEHKMFHPRFAGGEKALLRRMDLVTHKWLSQCVHHTTIGLPFTPTEKGKVEKSDDPMLIVSWNAAWLFTQQIYLLLDLNNMDGRHLETVWWICMIKFARALEQPDWEARLADELIEIAGDEVGRLTLGDRIAIRWHEFRDKLFRRHRRD